MRPPPPSPVVTAAAPPLITTSAPSEGQSPAHPMPPKWDADIRPGPVEVPPTLVQVQPGTYEWSQVVILFLDDNMVDIRPGDIAVERIERVHNKFLWGRYQSQLLQFSRDNGGDPNELWLKYGTCQTPPGLIWDGHRGIDFIDYGRPGMFGRAVYCTDAMEYSHNGFRYKVAGQPGRAQVFLVKFLAGRVDDQSGRAWVAADSATVGPSPNHGCIRGKAGAPGLNYMSYSIHTTYPMYLITYRFPPPR